MIIREQVFESEEGSYTVRSAVETDAEALSELRLVIDGETENMDREPGEAYIDAAGFRQLIRRDSELPRNLFLVAETGRGLAGFCRCEGVYLRRFSHKVEFGVGVAKAHWGHGIGKNLLQASIAWADRSGIRKMSLSVLETNDKAIRLYRSLGFETEGLLRDDRLLSDGKFYSTLLMSRLHVPAGDGSGSGGVRCD
ncbi:GNAT family N-acetyltransferase [Gorillibacterium sp. sgz5001074]|uniref:GNAT family N-acetyltransferase n=1 Tax=Gorillibacterium sp. sgz5001074 TaxID=3446695 RepID=UPI003F67BE0D